MTRDELIGLLVPAGFEHQASGMFENVMSSFIRPAGDGWFIAAHATWRADPDHVDLGVMRDTSGATIGTHHRFLDVGTLQHQLAPTIASLEALITEPDSLKCPQCGRWVVLKEPSAGDTWAPFLSCEGFRIVGRKPNKTVQCRGTSKRIPALVLHR